MKGIDMGKMEKTVIKMLETENGSDVNENGISEPVHTYKKGRCYEVGKDLVKCFVDDLKVAEVVHSKKEVEPKKEVKPKAVEVEKIKDGPKAEVKDLGAAKENK